MRVQVEAGLTTSGSRGTLFCHRISEPNDPVQRARNIRLQVDLVDWLFWNNNGNLSRDELLESATLEETLEAVLAQLRGE